MNLPTNYWISYGLNVVASSNSQGTIPSAVLCKSFTKVVASYNSRIKLGACSRAILVWFNKAMIILGCHTITQQNPGSRFSFRHKLVAEKCGRFDGLHLHINTF